MICEIISVGTELLLGDILNTDTMFLSKELACLGIDVLYHTTVGDNAGRLEDTLKTAALRADLIITTGGLGPTGDDLTKEIVCKYFNEELILHEPSLKRMQDFFNAINLIMPENNKKQAMMPKNSIILDNDYGTAPGCILNKHNKIVIMLPGPINELKPMFLNYAVSYLSKLSNEVISSHNLHIFGMGEAAVYEIIEDLTLNNNPTLAPYAKTGEVMLRVTAKSDTKENADILCQPVINELKDRLGNFIYGLDCNNLEQHIIDLLTKKGKTLSLAESCTGGLLAKRITDISGSSKVFNCGIVSYSNDIKHSVLNVSNDLLTQYGAVSRQVASQMAAGVKKVSGSDYALSITGIAGPNGGTSKKPVGLVYIAAAFDDTVIAEKHIFDGSRGREYIRQCACNYALNLLRRALIK
jgi:competence/damage-inducible protein CinA C-terminal domain